MSTATSALSRLEEITGREHVVADPANLAAYTVDGVVPAAAVRPASVEEIAGVLRLAAAEKLALIVASGRTKLGVGAPPRRYDVALDVTRLNRILAYDPGDLTLGVEPGLRFADLNEALAQKDQFVPLAPAFADRATIGGILAANAASPLRHAYGSPRDFLLGLEFVTGEGVASKSGGRVVKNVTGYDLHKLLIGSLGTLAVITRANFRTFPLPPAQTTFVASFADADAALRYSRAIAKSPLQPRLVDALDAEAVGLLRRGATLLGAQLFASSGWSVVVTAAGNERVVQRHAADLARLARETCAAGFAALSTQQQSLLLDRLREFPALALAASPAATLFKLTVLPTRMPALLARIREIAGPKELAAAVLVRTIGIVYLALLPLARDAIALRHLAEAAAEIFAAGASAEIAARAVIEWCPAEMKRQVNVWGPPAEDLALMQRLKSVFDPAGILAPGRFAGGI